MTDHAKEAERILEVGSSETTTGEDATVHALLALVEQVKDLDITLSGCMSALTASVRELKRVADAMEAKPAPWWQQPIPTGAANSARLNTPPGQRCAACGAQLPTGGTHVCIT